MKINLTAVVVATLVSVALSNLTVHAESEKGGLDSNISLMQSAVDPSPNPIQSQTAPTQPKKPKVEKSKVTPDPKAD